MLFRISFKNWIKILIILTVVCSIAIAVPYANSETEMQYANTVVAGETKKFIKWVEFKVPYSALNKAMNTDINSYNADVKINWIEVLAYLACKYGGNWKNYKAKDIDVLAEKLKKGEKMDALAAKMKHYSYFYESYSAILSGFLGEYEMTMPNPVKGGATIVRHGYGLKVFSPFGKGFYYSHSDDFGNKRTFGFNRGHLGNDLCGSVGTPIVAVESGTVECMGWNMYGGWRIGIRSFDQKRYYYYAHLRKGHPYQSTLKVGDAVTAGEVIGYLGMTGYSTKEDTNNMKVPHLHFGLQLIFDESQKECNNEIWIDVYDLVNLIERNRSPVLKDPATKEYKSTGNLKELNTVSQVNGE